MRNLFVGYFHTPKTKRPDVLRLMGNVLGLSREDVDNVSDDLPPHMSRTVVLRILKLRDLKILRPSLLCGNTQILLCVGKSTREVVL